MSQSPAYASMPLGFGPVVISAANANRDGTGTIVQAMVGRGQGSRIERVLVKASVTTTAGMVRIFKKATGLSRAATGEFSAYAAPTWRLIAEITVSAITPSATVASWTGEWAPAGGHVLADGEQLGISTEKAESMNAEAWGGHI